MTAGSETRREAVALAHPNVALSKYWGKREGPGNFPAVPSLSITLGGLATRTRVTWRADVPRDRFVLNGREVDGGPARRAFDVLDIVRAEAKVSLRAEIESSNDFPTASGLASSASGFAALALASVASLGSERDWDGARISDLARRASASAARSVFGGFVELDAGPLVPREGHVLSAHPVASAEHMPTSVLVCVTTQNAKATSSTDGMRATMETSPYASAWLDHAPRLHAQLRDALLARDFDRVGSLAESSALAMHACALAAGLSYWNAGTLEALAAVRDLRKGGIPAFATIDAGPHVKVLVRPDDVARATATLRATSGVQRVITATVGGGARLLRPEEAAA